MSDDRAANNDRAISNDRYERLRRRAEKILNDGGIAGGDASYIDVQELVHELYVHQAELEIQNEELRGAQQALEVSRREYAQLFQALPLVCFTVSAAGIVGEANAAAEQQFGLPHRQLKGRPLTLLVDPADHGRLLAALGRLREDGAWTRQEFRYRGAGGLIDGLTDARRVALEDGDRGDLLLSVTDVTERNEWLRQVQVSRDAAERARAAYHHILQAVADGILGIDATALVTFANTAAVRLTGLTGIQLLDRPVEDLLVGGDAADALTQSLTDGATRRVAQQEVRRADGSHFTAALTISPIVDQGRVTGAVMALRDVTVQLAAEDAMRLSEQRHRTLVKPLHEGLVMHGADGGVLVANAMAEQLLDGPAAFLLDPRAEPVDGTAPRRAGAPRRRVIGPDGFLLRGLPPAAQAFRTATPVVEQVVGLAGPDGPGGPTRWLRVSSHPVLDTRGRVEAVVSSVTDITTMKAMEQALNVALDTKERFMASASHDLRQPVQALMLFTDLMLKRELGGDARRLAEQMRESVGSLGAMLDGLLDISKLEAGLITPSPAPVDVGALLERLHGECEPQAVARGLRLTTVPTHAVITTDPTLLERVVRNLLSNAMRYTRHGRVLCGVRRRRGQLRIEVWDTGIGVAENQIDRIFQDFYQVANQARDRREGLGMGLSIAKRLAVMLGGTIDVRSTPGRGSCFAIGLPLDVDRPDGKRPGQEPAAVPSRSTATGGTDGDRDGEAAVVLLVEDDAVIRLALGMMLEGWGYAVADAGSVGDALHHLDTGLRPDIVLADYRLPDGETGLMLMDTVRRRLGDATPGILLTGDTSSDRLREASAAQCALLHKPIQPTMLRDTVRRCLDTG